MNDHKIGCQGRIQVEQNHGLIIPDRSFEFGSHSFGAVQQNNVGIWPPQQQHMNQQTRLSQSQLQNLVSPSNKSSSPTIMINRFESPASAFYAAERCMGFSQYDSQLCYNNNNNSNNPCLNSHFSSGQSCSENYSIDISDQSEPNFEFRTSLQQVVKPLDIPSFSHSTSTSVRRQFSVPCKENQDLGAYCGSFNNSPISQPSFANSSHQERQSPRFSSGNGCAFSTTVNSASTGPANGISSKTRIRWTQDLHEKFVECINRLGGAEKATPKAILKLMDSEALTIFHVKSHLQKYRIAKYLPGSSEGKSEKRTCINLMPQLEATTGLQIKEALQLQLDVQRRLHEQLEIQRNLQLQIEEQGRQLKMMFDMQQRTSNSLFKSQSSDITSPDDDDEMMPHQIIALIKFKFPCLKLQEILTSHPR